MKLGGPGIPVPAFHLLLSLLPFLYPLPDVLKLIRLWTRDG